MKTFSILLLFVSGSAAICNVQLQEPTPTVIRSFGSKSVIIQKTINNIQLSTNENATLHCPNGFVIDGSPYYNELDNQITLHLTCYSNRIYVSDYGMDYIGGIKCKDYGISLYESDSKLQGCDANASTLLVGYKSDYFPDVTKFGICYEVSALRLRFISYLFNPTRNLVLEEQVTHELSGLQLNKKIGRISEYFTLPNLDDFRLLMAIPNQFDDLFEPQLFEYGNLVQDVQEISELREYEDMLSIVWLRSLRVGNWRNWMSAMHTHFNENGDKFNVRVGVSGVITFPHDKDCTAIKILRMETSNDMSFTVPQYIWAHVKSLQPENQMVNEFVIVAHNSPYADVMELSSFCTDLCDQIPWLRNSQFGKLHLIPSYGVVQCCPIDQVDFPLANHNIHD